MNTLPTTGVIAGKLAEIWFPQGLKAAGFTICSFHNNGSNPQGGNCIYLANEFQDNVLKVDFWIRLESVVPQLLAAQLTIARRGNARKRSRAKLHGIAFIHVTGETLLNASRGDRGAAKELLSIVRVSLQDIYAYGGEPLTIERSDQLEAQWITLPTERQSEILHDGTVDNFEFLSSLSREA